MINNHRVVLITGARRGVSKSVLCEALDANNITAKDIVIHGNCRGTDQNAANILAKAGIHSVAVPALWDKHKLAAGPIRNNYMLSRFQPDLVLAFPHSNSKGTRQCIKVAKEMRLKVVVYEQ